MRGTADISFSVPTVMSTEEGLKQLARNHWSKHRPKMYQRLRKSGVLEELLNRAVEFTREDMRGLVQELKAQGFDETQAQQQAWQILSARWILLPDEK
jgi:pantoate kinase